MTRYVELGLFACPFLLVIACQSEPPSSRQVDAKRHAVQPDRTAGMTRGEHPLEGQTPHLPQVDQKMLDRFTQQEPRFKEHYDQHYADSGYGYNQYRPAYQYGYELATDDRYKTMDWSTIELQARRGWDEGTMGLWDRYKDAVHFGWERGVIAQRG